MNELECIGRYHQLVDGVKTALDERNSLMIRAAAILKAASEPPISRYNMARKCNFDAAQTLFESARLRNEEALMMLEELRQVAPVANKPIPTLE